MLPHIHKTIAAIEECRTSKLGMHEDVCNECGYAKIKIIINSMLRRFV